jgi:hypothetical protein
MSVLDVGTGAWWFATHFEQLGADVTATDVRGYCDFDVFGRPRYPEVTTKKPSPDLLGRYQTTLPVVWQEIPRG